jgi:hypothetical protein
VVANEIRLKAGLLFIADSAPKRMYYLRQRARRP